MNRYLLKLKRFTIFSTKRKVNTLGEKTINIVGSKLEELDFLDSEIKNNLHKLKCIEQKKIKNDSIAYKKILKNIWEERHNFVAEELVQFLYIVIYNGLYYTDICIKLFSYFYKNYIFTPSYLNNINVNSVIHIIYSFYLTENYIFLTSQNVFNLEKSGSNKNEEQNINSLISNKKIKNNKLDTIDKMLNDLTKNKDSRENKKESFFLNTDEKNTKHQKEINIKDTEKYKQYYNNDSYVCFHIYNLYAPFIHLNINYINKCHLVKILLVLSYFINNSVVNIYMNKKNLENIKKKKKQIISDADIYNEQDFTHIEKNLFILLETFIEKVNIKKNIKKSYPPEIVNEKEIEKKNKRYENLIDNFYKNYIYIENDINDHKLICLYFFILSNIFYPLTPNFVFLETEQFSLDQQNFSNLLQKEELKKKEILKTIHQYDKKTLPIIQMFENHYSKLDILNMFYQNINKEQSSIEKFTIYKNNILKNIKKYVFLEPIYALDLHYKILFFKATYSLNFFNFPFLKYIYIIQSYQKKNDIDQFDYYENTHFCNVEFYYPQKTQATDTEQKDKIKNTEKENEKDIEEKQNNHPNEMKKKAYEKKIQTTLKELSKFCNIFDIPYVNLLNEIENSITNNTYEQIINALLYIHLYRAMDTHFTILLFSKMCNLVDKLSTEHKKKIDIIIKSFLTYLSAHIQYNTENSFTNFSGQKINIFNHVYYTNNIYIKHLNQLYNFLLVLYNKKIFSRKKKDLVSWANYKCI